MNIKKIKKKIAKEIERDPFIRFAKENNPTLYQSEFNKVFNREMKYQRQKTIGEKEAKRQMDFIEAELKFSHINDHWLRKHLAYKQLQKDRKQLPKRKKSFYL